MTSMIERIPGLPLVRLEVPTPFPVGPVNVYLSLEPEPVLLDTGPATPDALEAVQAGLRAAGLAPRDLKQIVISHGHEDHYGLAAELTGQSGAAVFAPERDRGHLGHDPDLYFFYAAQLRQAGVPDALLRRMEERFLELRTTARPLLDYRPMSEFGGIRCGDALFAPFPTPGHTPGGVSFFDAPGRRMLAADTVLKNITPNPVLDRDDAARDRRFPSLRAYLDTLNRIRQRDPRVIYTAHGEPVTEFAAWHDRVLAHHERRQQALRHCLAGNERTVYQLTACLFPDERTHNSFLAISEVYAHLDILVAAGRARTRFDGPLALYSL